MSDHRSPTVNVLGSYYFLRKTDLTHALTSLGTPVDFFADSGAFSASTSGAQIDIKAYARWLIEHRTVVNAAVSLDVIGNPRATERNQDELQSLVGDAVTIVPIFHIGSPWKDYERMVTKYRYVGIGGAVAFKIHKRTDPLVTWLTKAHVIARDADCRLHGLGLTRPPIPELFPWYSVDSSFWNVAQRIGRVSLWNPDTREWATIHVGTPKVRQHAPLIRRYGGDPNELATPGFGLVRIRGTKARQEYEWMTRACLRAWVEYETFLRSRYEVQAPSSSHVTGTGPKIYFAVGSYNDMKLVVSATEEQRV